MKYKAVIFDFDDTLVESRELKWAQHKVVAKKFYDIDLSDSDIREHWGKPFDVLVMELYKNSDTLENMHKAIISTKDDFKKKVYEGANELIENLLGNDIEVGVVSAANKNYLIEDLSRLNFPHENFAMVQGADETKVHKPHPDVFLPVFDLLKQKQINKEHILYVGDSIDDFYAASGAGIDFIAITTGLYTREDFEKEGVNNIVSHIKEVLKYLQ